MSFTNEYSSPEAQLTMTLSALAYTDEQPLPGENIEDQKARMRKDINQALSVSSYPDWQVVWGPGLSEDRSNMMYVGKDQKTNQYAVVIRGTDWSFWLDWLEDFGSLLELVPFPYPNDSSIQIALGTYLGWQQLVQMQSQTPDNNQIDLLTFLKQLPSDVNIFITGHSLGGCLASVVASWLAEEFGTTTNLKVYTFAAPSAGNKQFATHYNNLFLNDNQINRAFRIYNSLDAVPNAWATLDVIKAYYQPLPHCTDEIKKLINFAQDFVEKQYYTQVGIQTQNSAIKLPGNVLFSSPTRVEDIHPISDHFFFLEVHWQHSANNYLNLLKAQPFTAATTKFKSIGKRAVILNNSLQ